MWVQDSQTRGCRAAPGSLACRTCCIINYFFQAHSGPILPKERQTGMVESQMEAVLGRCEWKPNIALYGLTAETLYSKCVALARNLWWSWKPEVINSFGTSTPSAGVNWTTIRSPCCRNSPPSGWRCGRPSWCCYAGLSPFEGVHGGDACLGRHPYSGRWVPAGRLFLPLEFGVQPQLVLVYLFGGLGSLGDHIGTRQHPCWGACWWPSACFKLTPRAISSSRRYQAGGVLQHQGGETCPSVLTPGGVSPQRRAQLVRRPWRPSGCALGTTA